MNIFQFQNFENESKNSHDVNGHHPYVASMRG
jgi:hypothetical protein